MSTERCLSIALASFASKSRLAAVAVGEGDIVGEALTVGDAEGVAVDEAVSSPPHATTQAARASAAIKRTRGRETVVGGP